MSKEIDLLERIISFAVKRAEVHFAKEEDGTMSFSEDYKAYVSILDDATTAKTLLKQQPTAGEPKCKTCGDTKKVPSEYGLTQCSSLPISPLNTKPCPDCQQPSAGEFTKRIREEFDEHTNWPDWAIHKRLMELCNRLDTSEAGRKDLLKALKRYGHHDSPCAGILDLNEDSECSCGFEATIAKAMSNEG